jgi:hypothetical protein
MKNEKLQSVQLKMVQYFYKKQSQRFPLHQPHILQKLRQERVEEVEVLSLLM